MSTPQPSAPISRRQENGRSPASQAPRADAEPIDWDNVAVETAVMLRLQQAPPVAQARARRGQPDATD